MPSPPKANTPPRRQRQEDNLIKAWYEGSRSAGHRLVEPHLAGLCAFFRCKIACAADVDDLVQRTLLACQRSLGNYRGEAGFKPYLFGIARFTLLKYYRRQCRKFETLDETCAVDLGPDPEFVVMQRAEVRLLMKAMRRIPLDYQIALELYHWERMKGHEIATVLKIPAPTVRSRLRRGLMQLRAKIAELAQSPEILLKTTMSFESWRLNLHQQLQPQTSHAP